MAIKKGKAAALFAAVSLIGAAAVVTSVQQASAATTLVAVADAHVQADFPTTNYGAATGLRVDASPISNAFLKFDVQGLTTPPTTATLRVFNNTAGTTGIKLSSVADTGWGETAITYNTAPGIDTLISTSGALTAGAWVSFDVTSLVRANGLVSFAVTTDSSSSRTIDSREGTNKPQLVLDTAAPPTQPPTGTFAPVADAHVQADFPTTNYGTATGLRVDASPVANAYLKFDVQGLSAAPRLATLRLFNNTAGSPGLKVSAVVDTAWGETTIRYDNAPPIGTLAATSGALTAGAWVSLDVTSLVRANGLVSFAVTTDSSSSRTIDSREGTNKPQLVLDTSAPTTTTTTPPGADPVIVAAGDVACAPSDANFNGGLGTPGKCHMKATSDLILGIAPAKVLMLGDAQYNSGSTSDFNAGYAPSWGRVKSITVPTVGNHEYGTSGAGGYFSYFGNAATPLQPGCVKNCNGWYSFDIGTWHIVVLNSECTRISGGTGCAVGSPQEQWLKADLAAHPNMCTMAVQHRPRWSSNSFASPEVAPLVDVLHSRGVDILMAGHAHSYERFAPQNPSGAADAAGVRQFVVGTGGSFYSGFGTIEPNSQVHKQNIFGVLKMTLHPTGYDWAFVADPSTPYTDSGSESCH